ncbi:MAG: tetratricopeptide repeat protein [Candidatus Eisenbacteria bacterium]|nr:tetratricopeptide repeat protein [Candidatus Eisenbacteria bacterium]
MQASSERVGRIRQWGAGLLLLLLLAGFLYYSSPPTRGGAADLVLLKARDLLGLVPAGEGLPTFPSWATWAGIFLAGVLRLAHVLVGGGETLASFVAESSSGQTAFLRFCVSCLAAASLVGGASLVARLARPEDSSAAPSQPDHASTRTGPAANSWSIVAVIAFVGVLLAAPLLADQISTVSPALFGTILLLAATWRLTVPSDANQLRWGAGSGVVLGSIFGTCGWLWPVFPVFALAASVARRGWRAVVVALVVGVALGLALDPAYLHDPSNLSNRLLTEWSRAGGWNLAPTTLGSRSVLEVLALKPLLGWGTAVGVVAAVGLWLFERRASLLVWTVGLFVASVLVPVTSGIRSLSAVQQAWGPVAVLVAAAGIDGVGRSPKTGRRVLGAVLALLAVVTAGGARFEARSAQPTASPEAVVEEIRAIVPPGARLLAERAVPGLEGATSALVLPRDSRHPERYDFAYWPRWYAGFDFVLLSEPQFAQNRSRSRPLHFYGQLKEQGEAIARWEAEGQGWVLYHVPETSPWREPLSRSELTAIEPNPDLLQFVDRLGSFYAGTGAIDLAEVLFQGGLQLDPSRQSFYNNLGSVYLLESEWEEAARVFEQGLRRDPDSPELCYNAGRAFFELGAYGRAESLLRRAVGLRPNYGDAHYELARTFLALDQIDLAKVALRQVLTLNPSPERRQAVESALAQLPASQGAGAGAGATR